MITLHTGCNQANVSHNWFWWLLQRRFVAEGTRTAHDDQPAQEMESISWTVSLNLLIHVVNNQLVGLGDFWLIHCEVIFQSQIVIGNFEALGKASWNLALFCTYRDAVAQFLS